MTMVKKASALFLSFILFDSPHHLYCTAYRILCLYTNFDLYRFMVMGGWLRRFWDLIDRQPCLGSAIIRIGRAGIS